MALKRIERIERPSTLSGEKLARILYVEDEDPNWEVTELHLRGKYSLRRARNSSEAFTLLAKVEFDLILLDIQLGGSEYDGIELCKIIKRRPGTRLPPGAMALRCDHIPVVFVTAYASRYDKATLLQAGADEVVTKPVDYTRLLLVSSRLAVKNLNSP
jgi:CheY-like chemotaxis protein